MSKPMQSVQFDLEGGGSDKAPRVEDNGPATSTSVPEGASIGVPPDPVLRRRATRRDYAKSTTVHTTPLRPNWEPGQEPGLDPTKPDGGRPHGPTLHEQCQITVVDYSTDIIEIHSFENEGLIEFLEKKQESLVKCRWINVNGLSWDVIQCIGRYKNLHRLAIEDLVSGKSLTKTEW